MQRRQLLQSAAVGAGWWGFAGARRAHAAAAALPSLRDRLGITVEEISPDLETALRFVRSFGLRWVEVRKLGGTYATDMSLADCQRARALLDKLGVKVSVFDTALYKCHLPGFTGPRPDEHPYAEQAALFQRALERAPIFGSKYLRIFSFWRDGDPKACLALADDHLKKACAQAKAAGVTLLVENLNGANVETSAEAADLLARIRSPQLGLAWDPNNAFCGHEDAPFPDGYRRLDWKRVPHIHLRDAAWDETTKKCRWLPVGKGKVDNRGLLMALARDRFPGTINLETHYARPDKNRELATRESLQGLLGLLDAVKT